MPGLVYSLTAANIMAAVIFSVYLNKGRLVFQFPHISSLAQRMITND